MTLLHAHTQYMYIYIVNAKYQKASVKALVQVDFPIQSSRVITIIFTTETSTSDGISLGKDLFL